MGGKDCALNNTAEWFLLILVFAGLLVGFWLITHDIAALQCELARADGKIDALEEEVEALERQLQLQPTAQPVPVYCIQTCRTRVKVKSSTVVNVDP